MCEKLYSFLELINAESTEVFILKIYAEILSGPDDLLILKVSEDHFLKISFWCELGANIESTT